MNGYGNLSQIDITGSINFLRSYIAEKISKGFKANRVLDCGSGIGRVAK
jgi:2-polyprenyl-3-methyl-5-hydroxy-6-metoxy-1,4-benzoquinol methylase